MDTLKAFALSKAAAARNAPRMVFDWHKAADVIRQTQPHVASAGLQGDWEYTGGEIWRDSKPVPTEETYVYLASVWAIPELSMDGEVMPCWRFQQGDDDWDAGTYWPRSALALLAPSPHPTTDPETTP